MTSRRTVTHAQGLRVQVSESRRSLVRRSQVHFQVSTRRARLAQRQRWPLVSRQAVSKRVACRVMTRSVTKPYSKPKRFSCLVITVYMPVCTVIKRAILNRVWSPVSCVMHTGATGGFGSVAARST